MSHGFLDIGHRFASGASVPVTIHASSTGTGSSSPRRHGVTSKVPKGLALTRTATTIFWRSELTSLLVTLDSII